MKILITGHSSGIGAQCASLFDSKGHDIIGISRGIPTCTQYNSISADLSTIAGIMHAADSITHISPDIYVHCAGSNIIRHLSVLTLDDLHYMFNLHTCSAFEISKRILDNTSKPHTFVFLSSIWSKVTCPNRGSYSLAKSALNSLVHQLAVDYSHLDVVSVGLSLGFVGTPLTKLTSSDKMLKPFKSRILNPKKKQASTLDVANFIYDLATSPHPYLNGSIIDYDGGITFQ